jgi:glycosyltransferase involved in cell wall biosynthesis
MNIANIGVYPPPFGGVSIHIQRLKAHLDLRGVPNAMFDVSGTEATEKRAAGVHRKSMFKVVGHLLLRDRSIVHMHNFSVRDCFYMGLLTLKHRVILSLHNERFLDEIASHPPWLRRMVVTLLNRVDRIIVSSSKSAELARTIIRDGSRVLVIPEFIPPAGIPDLDPSHPIWLQRQNHRYLIASGAWQLSFYKGVDLYGVDLLVELIGALSRNGYDITCCFLLPQIGDAAYFDIINRRVDALGIHDRFHFITHPIPEASSLWRLADLVIRSTNTDGNSVTVMEALAVGTPVLASDCVPRPEGVLLFESRNGEDLARQSIFALDHLDELKRRVGSSSVKSSIDAILGVYRSVSGHACAETGIEAALS